MESSPKPITPTHNHGQCQANIYQGTFPKDLTRALQTHEGHEMQEKDEKLF